MPHYISHVTTRFVSMIVTTLLLLTVVFANTLSFPSALSNSGENTTNTTTDNISGVSDSDGDNATGMNVSGKISGFHDECPFSFC